MRIARIYQRFILFVGGRMTLLLFTLLLLLLLTPFLDRVEGTVNVVDVIAIGVLLGCVRAAAPHRIWFWFSCLIVAVLIPFRIVASFSWTRELVIVEHTILAVFFAMTAVLIVGYVLRATRVTVNEISGALCVFLLMGLVWAFAYSVLEFSQPGAFAHLPRQEGYQDFLKFEQDRMTNLVYFSFVTITTLGYGDICPVLPPAKYWATLEAILGQIFLVVLVARLVGLQITHSGRSG